MSVHPMPSCLDAKWPDRPALSCIYGNEPQCPTNARLRTPNISTLSHHSNVEFIGLKGFQGADSRADLTLSPISKSSSLHIPLMGHIRAAPQRIREATAQEAPTVHLLTHTPRQRQQTTTEQNQCK
jgi:hypothetical protein